MNKESITSITDDVTEMLLKKNADYGAASFDLGLNGNMVHLWDKVKRYRSLITSETIDSNFEGLEDTLRDIIGYAIIGLHILNDQTVKNKINGDINIKEL